MTAVPIHSLTESADATETLLLLTPILEDLLVIHPCQDSASQPVARVPVRPMQRQPKPRR